MAIIRPSGQDKGKLILEDGECQIFVLMHLWLLMNVKMLSFVILQ